MKYYPIFLDLAGARVVFSGAGEHAAAKVRLLLKTEADIVVVGENPAAPVREWASAGRVTLIERSLEARDVQDARLVYGANDDPALDAAAVALGRAAGALANIVDDLSGSDFLTPAIVDRDPVVVAIGTEGTAPVLARTIKRDLEETLPASTGALARIANGFRPIAARLRTASLRRTFWQRFFQSEGPKALVAGGETGVRETLLDLFNDTNSGHQPSGEVALIGTGPGDPELLTLKARRKLHEADIVLHDNLVTDDILELARREAKVINVGKKGFGKSTPQERINALLVEYASDGHKVARLKSGDPAIFGRLDEEIEALEEADIEWEIVPGITAASAAAAGIGASLTRRGRNSALRILTAHDVNGFAEQDWRTLAQTGSTAAIYMGVKASTFLAGRLLMHGASAETPLTIVENASRADQKVVATTLADLPRTVADAHITGPAILLLGLSPRSARQVLPHAAASLKQQEA